MDFDEWIKTQGDRSAAWKRGAESAFNAGQEIKQGSINHMREYLITGMQCAPENSEYWLALRDCLDEFERIVGKEK